MDIYVAFMTWTGSYCCGIIPIGYYAFITMIGYCCHGYYYGRIPVYYGACMN